MHLTYREIWTAAHGMIFGAGIFILFMAAFAGLWMMKADRLTPEGAKACARFTSAAAWIMALLAWAAVIIGTYMIYPWYRSGTPGMYPKALLLASPQTADWHELGMEWKEHVAWLAPMLITAVAFAITKLGPSLANHRKVRSALLFLICSAFFCAVVAGFFGAMINKAAPTR